VCIVTVPRSTVTADPHYDGQRRERIIARLGRAGQWDALEKLMTDWLPAWDKEIKNGMKLINAHGLARVNAAGTVTVSWNRATPSMCSAMGFTNRLIVLPLPSTTITMK